MPPISVFLYFRKKLSSALFLYLALKEAVERGDSVEFGPLQQAGKTVSLKETIHTYLQHVDKERCDEVYTHNDCCKDCEGRGCGRW